jgi:hypothetical protein
MSQADSVASIVEARRMTLAAYYGARTSYKAFRDGMALLTLRAEREGVVNECADLWQALNYDAKGRAK